MPKSWNEPVTRRELCDALSINWFDYVCVGKDGNLTRLRLIDLDKLIAALEGEEEAWEPKDVEEVFTFDGDGVFALLWRGDSLGRAYREGLGIYPTRELAQAAFERAKKAAKGIE